MSNLRRQGTWAVVDQVLSSGTNFVPALLLARVLGPASYGAFSLAFLAWFSTLTFLTSALMLPYTLAAAAVEGESWRDVTERASGAVVLAGVLAGVLFAIAGTLVGPSTDLGRALLAIAVLAPGLALQEFWRVAAFAASRAKTAAANDACWAIGQILAFGILFLHGHTSVAGCLLAWGLGAWLAAGLGIQQLSVIPRVNLAALRWAREWVGAVGAWFTVASTTYTLGIFVVAIVIAAKTGNADLGLFRTVQNLFGPIQLLTIGGQNVFLPYLVRTTKTAGTNGLREVGWYSLLMTGSIAVYGLLLLLAARTVLTKVFGAAFAPAAVLVLPTLIFFLLGAISMGAELQLRVHAKGRRIAVAQLATTLLRLAAVVVLVRVDGLRGAVWGLVIGSGVGVVAFWVLALSADRPHGESRRRHRLPPSLRRGM